MSKVIVKVTVKVKDSRYFLRRSYMTRHFGVSSHYPWTLSPVHTSNNVQATSSNATSWTILSTMSNVASTLLPFLATMLPVSATISNEIALSTKSKQIEHVQFVLTLSKGRNFVRHSCLLLRHCGWCRRGLTVYETVADWRSWLLPELIQFAHYSSSCSDAASAHAITTTSFRSPPLPVRKVSRVPHSLGKCRPGVHLHPFVS